MYVCRWMARKIKNLLQRSCLSWQSKQSDVASSTTAILSPDLFSTIAQAPAIRPMRESPSKPVSRWQSLFHLRLWSSSASTHRQESTPRSTSRCPGGSLDISLTSGTVARPRGCIRAGERPCQRELARRRLCVFSPNPREWGASAGRHGIQSTI